MRPTFSLVVLGALVLIGATRSTAAAGEYYPSEVEMRGTTRTTWPLADLRARGYDIPELTRSENAAWTYLDAINAFEDLPEGLSPAFDEALKGDWPSGANGKELRRWLLQAGNQRAIALAREASRIADCQFPYFGNAGGSLIHVLLPNLSDYRMLAKLTVVDGRRLVQENQPGQALEGYEAVFRMGDHVARGITLIEGLVGIACSALADNAMRDLAVHPQVTAPVLKELLRRTAGLADLRPSVRRGTGLERRFCHAMVDDIAARPTAMLANLQAIDGGFLDTASGPPPATGWGALEARIGRLVFPDRTIKAHMDRYFDELTRRAQLPAHEARWEDGWDERLFQSLPQWDLLTRMLVPSLTRASIFDDRLCTQCRMTRIAAALRLYADQHGGRAPDSLEAVTGLLGDADVLTDPFSGTAFAYRPAGEGWILYSFAENCVDDDGRESERAWKLDYVCRYPPAASDTGADATD